jgi:4'-phosphopantetheinyl transferase
MISRSGPVRLQPVLLRVPPLDQVLTGRSRVARLSALARMALRASARLSGLALGVLEKDAQGVPVPAAGVYWSLTHKPALVGGVAAPVPVGLDLEAVRPVSQGLRTKVATPEEWDLAAGEPQAFFRFWTAKEATLKLTGRGLGGLSGCRVVRVVDRESLDTGCEGRIYRVRQLDLQNHWAAVAGEAAAVQWHVLDSADLRPEDGAGD